MSIRARAFKAVRWTAVGSFSSSLIQVLQLAVLARILTPEDFGLMAFVTVVLSFANIVSDFGINSAFVQRRDVTIQQRSSLFWFNVFVSICMMFLVLALSPLLASLVGDPRLEPLMMLSALVIPISAMGVQIRMAAEKALRFQRLVLLELLAVLVGFTVAFSAARSGWNVYALVAGAIASSVASTVLVWLFLADGWRPGLRLKVNEVRAFLGFGGALVANNIVSQINLTVDLLLGGRFLTATQLGLYSVPRNLSLQIQFIVNPIVTRVAFPLIAEIQHDIERVRSVYLQSLNMTASTNAPIYVFVAFFAQEIVAILLGAGWENSGYILQILALWGAVRSTGNPVGSLLLGMGRADLSLKWNLVLLLALPPAIWFGSSFGPKGVAWALLLLVLSLYVPAWFVLVRPVCHAGLREYSHASLRPFLIAAFATAPCFWLVSCVENIVLRLILGGAGSVLFYCWLSHLFNRQWFGSMMELIGQTDRTQDETSL